VTLHGKWSDKVDAIARQTLCSANWVAGCSSAILEEGRKLAPEIVDRSSIIYNGVEAPSLTPAPLPFAPPRLLCLGRLVKDKGFDVAMTAFVKVLGLFPDARLLIAGDGIEKASLETQAANQGISRSVEFLGWVPPDRVAEFINSSTMVIMPSRQDSFPL